MMTLWQVVESQARRQQAAAYPPPASQTFPSMETAGSWALARWAGGSHCPSVPLHPGGSAQGLAVCRAQACGLERGVFQQMLPEPWSLGASVCLGFLPEAWLLQCSQRDGFLEEAGRAIVPCGAKQIFSILGRTKNAELWGW